MSDPTTIDPADFRAVARNLTDTLAKGWEKGRIDQIMTVFNDEAVFVETPFSAPLTGIVAIRQWMSDIPYAQSETTFRTGELCTAGPRCSTDITLRFRRRKTGQWVEARGAFFAETDGELITELRMFWHRWNGGQETSLP